MTCAICCEAMTVKKKVSCLVCDNSACTTCVRTYLTSSPITPQCMHCHARWDRDVLERLLPKTFINKELKQHRETALFDEMRMMLPSLQPYAQVARDIRKLELENVAHLQKIHDIQSEIRDVLKRYNWSMNACDCIVDLHTKRIKEIKKIEHNNINIRLKRRDIAPVQRGESSQVKTIRGCPAADCRGFITVVSDELECGMCGIKCCKKCHEVLDVDVNSKQEHECKKDDIETVKMLMKETKPCPQCSARIFKIDGCDLMWCTQCHVAFSWRSGEIHKGHNHNPHYYEYLRRTQGNVPRDPNDRPCQDGALPSIRLFDIFDRQILAVDMDHFYSIHRNVMHLRMDTLPQYQNNPQQNQQENRDIALKYLANVFTEEKCKSELYKKEKAMEKRHAIYQVIDMLTATAADVMRAALVEKDFGSMMQQLDTLKEFANTALRRIAKVYDCTVPILDANWNAFSLHQEEKRKKNIATTA